MSSILVQRWKLEYKKYYSIEVKLVSSVKDELNKGEIVVQQIE